MRKLIFLFFLIPFLLSFCAKNLYSQDSLKQKIKLKEVTVDAARIKTPIRILPFSITYRTFEKQQVNNPQLSLQDYLNAIPGLFSQNSQNFAQDLRLSIRGFGARSAFGIRGIQLLVDGIPETTPDGQGQLDNLPLGLINSLTVLRGPASTFYGNASGGVIKINTISDFEDNFARFRAQAGSFNQTNLSATVGIKNKKLKTILYQNISQSDGYRNHSSYKQQVFNARIWYNFSDSSKLNWQFNFTHSPFAYDPGGINIESVNENRRQSRQQNENFNTYESVDHLKTGFQWEKQFSKTLKFNSYIFYAYREFQGRLPFEFGGLIDLKRNYFGGGVSLEYMANDLHRIQLRISYSDQTDMRKRFRNIQGIAGDNTLDQEESFSNNSISILNEYRLGFGILRTGIRYDRQIIGIDSDLFSTNLNILNPSIGITSNPIGKNIFYSSFSTSFETPTLSELSANPNGTLGFNPDLNASKANNFELGWRLNSKIGKFQISLFNINTKNEILPYEIEDFSGRTFYRNAGKTKRKGLELEWSRVGKNIDWVLSYNYSEIKFDEFTLDGVNIAGNYLPGIPRHQFSEIVEYKIIKDLGLRFANHYTGSLYADDENETKIQGFFVSNVRIWKDLNNASFFAGVNNFWNRSYFDNIRINAWGKRYYEPAPKRNFYFGLNYNF